MESGCACFYFTTTTGPVPPAAPSLTPPYSAHHVILFFFRGAWWKKEIAFWHWKFDNRHLVWYAYRKWHAIPTARTTLITVSSSAGATCYVKQRWPVIILLHLLKIIYSLRATLNGKLASTMYNCTKFTIPPIFGQNNFPTKKVYRIYRYSLWLSKYHL